MKKSLIYGVSTAIIFYITTVYILEPFGMFNSSSMLSLSMRVKMSTNALPIPTIDFFIMILFWL